MTPGPWGLATRMRAVCGRAVAAKRAFLAKPDAGWRHPARKEAPMKTTEASFLCPSGYGYSSLEQFAKRVYGERGSFDSSLRRYAGSAEFLQACRAPQSVEDVPEITLDDVKRIVRRDAELKALAADVAAKIDVQQGKGLEDGFVLEAAGVMGIAPGASDWPDVLFSHLVDLFVSSKDEADEVMGMVREADVGDFSAMLAMLSDQVRGNMVLERHGRWFLSQGYARNMFRGENAYNVRCQASIYRELPDDPEAARAELTAREVRVCEFGLWLNQLSFVRDWPFGDVFHGAIAQHYGIPTNAIDVTSDPLTALFFACCAWDGSAWKPLCASETAETGSRTKVDARGGDSRYGVLFIAPVDVSCMSETLNGGRWSFTGFTPVGHQPLLRCASQSAYVVEAARGYDMYQDLTFAKTKIRLTPELCEWIYRKMDQGKAVYPQEAFEGFLDVVDVRLVDEVGLCSPERTEELDRELHRRFASSPLASQSIRTRIIFSI